MKTVEEIEQIIINRLKDGKGRAFNELTSTCRYLTDDGNRCAVGAVMGEHAPPNNETTLLDIVPISNQWKSFADSRAHQEIVDALTAAGVPANEGVRSLLYSWQYRHDDKDNWSGNKYIGHINSLIE